METDGGSFRTAVPSDGVMIINGDCLSFYIYKKLGLDKTEFDLIIFDPPFYSEKFEYRQRTDTKNKLPELITLFDFHADFERIIRLSIGMLKKSGWFIFKCDDMTFAEAYPICMKYMEFHRNIIWDKGVIGKGFYVRPRHEVLSVWRPKNYADSYFLNKPDMVRKNGRKKDDGWHGEGKGLALPSVIKVMPIRAGMLGSNSPEHVNETPIALWTKILRFFCPPKGTVFDPFMGTGSIGAAARAMELRYIGIEIDMHNFNIAKKRLSRSITRLGDFIGDNDGENR